MKGEFIKAITRMTSNAGGQFTSAPAPLVHKTLIAKIRGKL